MITEKQLLSHHLQLDEVYASGLDRSRCETIELVREWASCNPDSHRDFQILPKFAQFMLSAYALYDAQQTDRLSYMGDWIGWALSDSIDESHVTTMNIGILVDFHESFSLTSWPGFRPTMIVYFAAFYYYARERTAMKEVGENFWAMSLKAFECAMAQPVNAIDSAEVFLGISMLCWAAKESPSYAEQFAADIERLALNPEIPDRVRSMFCIGLATRAGKFSSMSPDKWAEKALSEFDDYLMEEKRVQMMVTVFCSHDSLSSAESILAEVELVQSERKATLGEIEFLRNSSQRCSVMEPYFVKCAASANTILILQGIQKWYQTSVISNQYEEQDVLITMPFGEYSYLAIANNKKIEIPRDNQVILEKLVHLNNEFIGIASTVAYADNSNLAVPERPGLPNYQQQKNFADSLVESYCPHDLELDKKPLCQLVLHSDCHPVQATQLMAWEDTWPISVSLSKPYPDRKPLSVAIWSGAGSGTEAMEIELVKHIFQASGATVDVHEPEESSVENFTTRYEDTNYDVFWVMSHGEFDHWYPEDLKLQIARDRTSVSINDLWGKNPLVKRRRLLVLNVCDGARVEEKGLLKKVGLAAGLAGPEQATISHLWPVQGFPAATFGAYLAYFLADGIPYFESYKKTLKAMRKDTNLIAEELSSCIGSNFELIERLKNRDENYSQIQFFGSAAFYQ